MFDLGFPELIVILIIILLLFGAKKLPTLSRSIGESMKELRKGMSDEPSSKTTKKGSNKTDSDKS